MENRGSGGDTVPADVRATVLELLVPLRHVAWGFEHEQRFDLRHSYGTAFRNPASTRRWTSSASPSTSPGRSVAGRVEALDDGKKSWMEADAWQACAAMSRIAWW